MKFVETIRSILAPTPTPLYFEPTPNIQQIKTVSTKDKQILNKVETNLNNGVSTIPTDENTWEKFNGIQHTEVWTMTPEDELVVVEKNLNRKVYAAIKQLNKRGTLIDGEYKKLGAKSIHKHMKGAAGYSVSNVKKYLAAMNKIGEQTTSPIVQNQGLSHSQYNDPQ